MNGSDLTPTSGWMIVQLQEEAGAMVQSRSETDLWVKVIKMGGHAEFGSGDIVLLDRLAGKAIECDDGEFLVTETSNAKCVLSTTKS